ncbi:MAG: glycosyltransferase family 4 protein [Gammaproteobacteria bacterium]|nr:glycosyltransferase family 4 protein [Gammaproteobacteria bacterium]
MRILFCNYEYPPLGGGGGVINALLAEELAKQHEVTVLTSQGLDLPRSSIENGVRIVRAPVFFRRQKAAANIPSLLAYIPMGIRAGRELLGSESFDIINTHFVIPSGPVGHHLSRFAHIPNILSVHGGDLYDPSKLTSPHRHAILRSWIRHLLRKADYIVGQSQNTVQNVHNYYDASVEVSRIPLGIKRPPKVDAQRQSYGFESDDILFVTVGRLVGRKAVDQLISNLHRLENPKVHLLIIGDGPQQPMLMELATSLGIDKQVHFYGFVDEMEKFRLLSIADIFATTSQHEGFGLVFLEAMAFGLPIVCYNHGGQEDFLENEKTGFFLPLNDKDAFISGCRHLSENADLRKNLGNNNRELVETYFIEHCANQYEELFTRIIQDKNKM